MPFHIDGRPVFRANCATLALVQLPDGPSLAHLKSRSSTRQSQPVPRGSEGGLQKVWASSLLIGLPFVNFACVETQFPNYPTLSRLVITE